MTDKYKKAYRAETLLIRAYKLNNKAVIRTAEFKNLLTGDDAVAVVQHLFKRARSNTRLRNAIAYASPWNFIPDPELEKDKV
jgi:hypothetical protein